MEVVIRIAVLASGSGTNLQSLIDTADLEAQLALVLSDRSGAAALNRAKTAGIPTTVVSWDDFDSRAAFSEAVGDAVEQVGAQCVVLAGFMRVLAPSMVSRFPNRMLNIHPSLLPAFPGSNAVAQALQSGVKVTGVTVHFVDEDVDHGPIIAQRPVPVLDDDDEETLHRRIQVEEHSLYPEVVRAFIRDEIRVVEGKVRWR